ncbi:hypothetical protein BS78_03G149800 [Paspalum vaginatum]|nr:hypothetical protein BS78_03G149800 [Paspalum vaginatum]
MARPAAPPLPPSPAPALSRRRRLQPPSPHPCSGRRLLPSAARHASPLALSSAPPAPPRSGIAAVGSSAGPPPPAPALPHSPRRPGRFLPLRGWIHAPSARIRTGRHFLPPRRYSCARVNTTGETRPRPRQMEALPVPYRCHRGEGTQRSPRSGRILSILRLPWETCAEVLHHVHHRQR